MPSSLDLQESPPSRRAIILTALPVEYLAVRAHLQNLHEEIHTQGTIYERGRFVTGHAAWDVLLAEVGAGNPGAAAAAERAVAHFVPEVALFVGIAGGVKDVRLGDVVAATKVYGYEAGKVEEVFLPRPEVCRSSHALEQRARAEARKTDWLARLSERPEPAPRAFVGPIAAGEKVVASTKTSVYQFLRHQYGDALAVEMEGHGFLNAMHANQNVLALVVRGISDLIDKKSEADIGGSQENASRNAAAFAFEVLARFGAVNKLSVGSDVASSALGVSSGPALADSSAPRYPKISISLLPVSSEHFVGRHDELSQLDKAWADPQTRVFSVTAWGGAGKTALINRWLQDRMEQNGWCGAEVVFAWSFYSQGLRETVATAESFINDALLWFGDSAPAVGSAYERGRRLASLVRQQRTLLILDGIEPLQHPPNMQGVGGRLKDPGLAALLRELAASMNGLCLVTSRFPVGDLAGRTKNSAPRLALDKLTIEDGALLLRQLGVKGIEAELRAASEYMEGHCLALTLLGNYLRKAKRGDIRCFRDLPLLDSGDNIGDKRARRVMAAYDAWLTPTERAILRIIGLFDRPAASDAIDALRRAAAIPGFTDNIALLTRDQWQITVSNLRDAGLVAPENQYDPDTLDAHPIVRLYFGEALRQENLAAWRAAHSCLFEHYEKAAPALPSSLTEMMPLFMAVTHGCLAHRRQEVLEDVYLPRIRRHEEQYSTHNLGAYGATLSALAGFFEHPWDRPAPELDRGARQHVTNAAGICLSALARTSEAHSLMQTFLAEAKESGNTLSLINALHNLSEVELRIGRIRQAVELARESSILAEAAGNAVMYIHCAANLAYSLCQSGDPEGGLEIFRKAEAIHQDIRTRVKPHNNLFSLAGYQYCHTLLERLSLDQIGYIAPNTTKRELKVLLNSYHSIRERAVGILKTAERLSLPIDVASSHVILGRAYIGLAVVSKAAARHKEGANHMGRATYHLSEALTRLRQVGRAEQLIEGLLRKAALHRMLDQPTLTDEYLREALEIAESGSMLLHECDIHLEWARLLQSTDRQVEAYAHLERVKEIMNVSRYYRPERELAALQGTIVEPTK